MVVLRWEIDFPILIDSRIPRIVFRPSDDRSKRSYRIGCEKSIAIAITIAIVIAIADKSWKLPLKNPNIRKPC